MSVPETRDMMDLQIKARLLRDGAATSLLLVAGRINSAILQLWAGVTLVSRLFRKLQRPEETFVAHARTMIL